MTCKGKIEWVPSLPCELSAEECLNFVAYDHTRSRVYDVVSTPGTVHILEVALSNSADIDAVLKNVAIVKNFPPGIVPMIAEYADQDGSHKTICVEIKEIETICGLTVRSQTGDIVCIDSRLNFWCIQPSTAQAVLMKLKGMPTVIDDLEHIPMTHDDDGNLYFTSTNRTTLYRCDYVGVQALYLHTDSGRFCWWVDLNTPPPDSDDLLLPISSIAVTRTGIHLKTHTRPDTILRRATPTLFRLNGMETMLDNMQLSNLYRPCAPHNFEVASCSGYTHPFVYTTEHTGHEVDGQRATVIVNRGMPFLVYKISSYPSAFGQLYRMPILPIKYS